MFTNAGVTGDDSVIAAIPVAARVVVRPRVQALRAPLQEPQFRALAWSDADSSHRTLAASVGMHALVLLLLASARLFAAAATPPAEKVIVSFFQPVRREEAPAPKVERHAAALPAPRRSEIVVPVHTAPPAPAPPPPAVAERVPEPVRPVPPLVAEAPPPPDLPKAVVRTGLFAEPVPVPEPAAPAIRETRTGGFDATASDPVPRGAGAAVLAGARLGSFDVAPGGARDGGTARSTLRVGTASVAGFDGDRGVRAAAGPRLSAGAGVKQGAFADAIPVVALPRHRLETAGVPDRPAEILSKPKPVYTEEARRLRIEGDVLLEVFFGASGQLRVLRVMQGLGHGLDEAAIEAARLVTFRPASRGGIAVDQTATLRVVFQLAY
jgi:TonB family protein